MQKMLHYYYLIILFLIKQIHLKQIFFSNEPLTNTINLHIPIKVYGNPVNMDHIIKLAALVKSPPMQRMGFFIDLEVAQVNNNYDMSKHTDWEDVISEFCPRENEDDGAMKILQLPHDLRRGRMAYALGLSNMKNCLVYLENQETPCLSILFHEFLHTFGMYNHVPKENTIRTALECLNYRPNVMPSKVFLTSRVNTCSDFYWDNFILGIECASKRTYIWDNSSSYNHQSIKVQASYNNNDHVLIADYLNSVVETKSPLNNSYWSAWSRIQRTSAGNAPVMVLRRKRSCLPENVNSNCWGAFQSYKFDMYELNRNRGDLLLRLDEYMSRKSTRNVSECAVSACTLAACPHDMFVEDGFMCTDHLNNDGVCINGVCVQLDQVKEQLKHVPIVKFNYLPANFIIKECEFTNIFKNLNMFNLIKFAYNNTIIALGNRMCDKLLKLNYPLKSVSAWNTHHYIISNDCKLTNHHQTTNLNYYSCVKYTTQKEINHHGEIIF